MMDEYWSLDVPGIDRSKAETLRDLIIHEAPFGVLLVDPSRVMLRGYDSASVLVLQKCLSSALAGGRLDRDEALAAQSMAEDCQEWLRQAGQD